jgi:hypothetical protein
MYDVGDLNRLLNRIGFVLRQFGRQYPVTLSRAIEFTLNLLFRFRAAARKRCHSWVALIGKTRVGVAPFYLRSIILKHQILLWKVISADLIYI